MKNWLLELKKKITKKIANTLSGIAENGVKGVAVAVMIVFGFIIFSFNLVDIAKVYMNQKEVVIAKQVNLFDEYKQYEVQRKPLGSVDAVNKSTSYAIFMRNTEEYLLLDFNIKDKIMSVGKLPSVNKFTEDEMKNGTLKSHKLLTFNDLSKEDRVWVSKVANSFGVEQAPVPNGQIISTFATMAMLLAMFAMQAERIGGSKKLKFIKPDEIEGDMNDLIGMEDVKQDVGRVEEFLKNRELFKSYGIKKPQNILFSGPPGTGKTKLAGFIAKKANLPVLFQSAANLETGLVNGGVGVLQKIVTKAKRMGSCIVFLDEAQDLFMKRGRGGRKFEDDTQNALLAILDGIQTNDQSEIIWIVASNFSQENMEMDEAMLRRFPVKVDFRLPNKEERLDILKHYLNQVEEQYKSKGIDLSLILNLTERRSPADLETIVKDAAVMAVRESRQIDTNDLLASAERLLMGLNNEETTAHLVEEKQQIAVHEVGHFLMEFLNAGGDFRKPVEVLEKLQVMKISLKANARTGALGFVFKKPRAGFLYTRKAIESTVQTLFAGMANETIFYGDHGRSNGATNDIKEATNLLFHAVVEARLYSPDKINFSAIKVNGEASPMTEEDKNLLKSISESLYRQTEASLKPLEELSLYLVANLIKNTEMTAEEMLKAMDVFANGEPVAATPKETETTTGEQPEKAQLENIHQFVGLEEDAIALAQQP